MIYFLTVNYYSTNLIAKLISSLPSEKNLDFKVIIINNSSDDNSISNLKDENVIILNAAKNLGFGHACNLGLKFIYAEDPQAIVWIINPDAYFIESDLEKVQSFFKSHPEISILGTMIYTPTGEVWFAGGYFNVKTGEISNRNLFKEQDQDYVKCDWVTGCSFIINLCKFRECPLFDPAYFLYYEDFDFCQRYAQQGHLIAVTHKFGVIHQPSSITNKYVFRKIKNSTYGYLLSLDRYTNQLVFSLRLTRLVFYALVLMFIKPETGLGKIYGVLMYWWKRGNQ
ncbi:glycosyltransferase [Fischerella thermalis]|uniref:Glycosyl transferase n=1 Tax=Fischerella thermalis CCMEE 5318 TaxID=2019666 RepID=A0A2N6L9U6_9CYAN|nr:glycosyltransferase [Fischerella thermalis]PMB19149.1 glycosyl transferase [Fischerella thermalis CCMEE 5318]